MDTRLQEYIRQVKPEIDMDGWQPQCPKCSGSINVDLASYFVFAQKHWCYGNCNSCQTRFLLDVPTLLYNFWMPQILDIGRGKIYGKPGFWQSNTLDIYFSAVEPKAALTIEKPEDKSKVSESFLDKIKENIDLLRRGDRRLVSNKIKNVLASKFKKAKEVSPTAKPRLEIKIKTGSESQPILLFNALDEFYGHSARFIQFIYNVYDELGDMLRKEGIATAILVRDYLEFYVPDFIDQIWTVAHLPATFRKNTFRDVELNRQLNEEIRKRTVFIPKKQTNITAGVDPREYFHLDLVEREAKLSLEQYSPIFVFYNREDYRCWGGHPQQELKNYSRLTNLLKKTYPSAGIYMVGMSRDYPINHPDIIDLRTNGIPENYRSQQIDYIYLLSKTDCAVGIHGSHMLDITGLAKTLVMLQPLTRYKNYSDDMFMIKSGNFVPDYCRFYPVFGKNETLSDVTPEQVRDLIEAALWNYRRKYLQLTGELRGNTEDI
jgi:hypothetical protein